MNIDLKTAERRGLVNASPARTFVDQPQNNSVVVNVTKITDPDLGELTWADNFTWKKTESFDIEGRKYNIDLLISSMKNTANSVDPEVKGVYIKFKANQEKYKQEIPSLVKQYISEKHIMDGATSAEMILEPINIVIGSVSSSTITGVISFKLAPVPDLIISVSFHPNEYDITDSKAI